MLVVEVIGVRAVLAPVVGGVTESKHVGDGGAPPGGGGVGRTSGDALGWGGDLMVPVTAESGRRRSGDTG